MGGAIEIAVDAVDWIMFFNIIIPDIAIKPVIPCWAAAGPDARFKVSVASCPMSKVIDGMELNGLCAVSWCTTVLTVFGPLFGVSQ